MFSEDHITDVVGNTAAYSEFKISLSSTWHANAKNEYEPE